MSTYVISDIHGEYDDFTSLLKKINFSEKDTLYILGDVLDRGPHPVRVLLEMMKYPNIIPILGNHELLGITCMRFLMEEITEENIIRIDKNIINKLLTWQRNGSTTTTDELHRLDKSTRKQVIDYIENFSCYEEVTVNGTDYLLVHAGLGNFSPDRPISDYSLGELVWERVDYEQRYFEDRYVITGHTPTQTIEGNPRPGYIYRKNGHIAIDCGACFGGRLACYCLETGEEFYSKE